MLRQAYPLWSGYGDKIISDQVKFVQFDQLNAPGQLFYSFFLSWLAVLDWIYKYAHLEKKSYKFKYFFDNSAYAFDQLWCIIRIIYKGITN